MWASMTSASGIMSNSSAGATISILWRPTLQNGILFWSANHIFFSLTGRRAVPDFALFETDFPAVETRKGHMLARANENASVLADFRGRAEVGGSGAHAMPSLGCAWTVAPRARSNSSICKECAAVRIRFTGPPAAISS